MSPLVSIVSAALPTISLNVPNNLSPRWSVDTISVSGNVTNTNTGDTVTVSWDDGSTSSGISISGNLWGPVSHIYGIGTSGNHNIVAQLYSSSNVLLVSSTTFTIGVQRHVTSLSVPVLNVPTVKWGKMFNVVNTVLTDTDSSGAGISGKAITYSGTAVTGAPFGTSNSTGGLASKVGVTASTNVGSGKTVTANFAGDSRYLGSSSTPANITINQHATASALGTIKVVPWSGATKFPATLMDSDNGGTVIQGRTMHFDGTGVIGVPDQITNGTGQVIGSGVSPSTVATGWTVQAHFAGDLLYANSDSIVAKYGTSKHPTFTSLIISAGTLPHGAIYKVTGILKDSLTGTALASKTVTFNATSPIVINPTTTNSTGSYTVSNLVAPNTPGTYSIQAIFGTDSLYSASRSPSKTITVT